MIDIKYYEGGTLKTKSVQEDDSSFRYRAIMGDDSITLKFTLAEAIEFPVGTFVEFQGSTYTLTSPENWSRYGNQNIEYTMLLNGVSATLGKYKLRNLQDNRLKFSMCTTPSEFLDLIVDNLNQSGRSSGWTAQCVIDVSEQKTIEFNHTYLIDALKSIADTFKTEYEITSSKVIKLGKVEYNKAHPLPLAYGAGNGFKAGTGRTNSNESKPVEILYVQGGERNIDRSKYGSAELHLPKGQTLEYEGRTYISDEDGLSIRRYGVEPKYGNEDSFDGTEIYPKRIGTVSAVTIVDADAHFYDFADNSIPNDLDYNDVLIDGETMTVIFQTGMLAGREFEISKYAHADRTFEIVPQEIDGIQMPDNTWKPVVGDTYIVYGCTLPDAYIADNDTKTGAEWDLFREAARNMYENEDFKFTFSGELQGKWAKEHWVNVGGKLIIGGYVRFSDTHFAPQGVDIRITGIKEFLGDPYSPIIEISNSIVSAGAFESALREASNQDVKIGDVLSNALNFTKRRFRDAQEAINMLEAAFGDKFSKGINPVSIQTMTMLVGDERLQFKVYDTSFTSIIAFPATFSNGMLSIEACGIRHFSLGITDTAITTSRSEDSYKKWTLQAQQLTPSDAASAYYLYAKVSRTSSSSASFELSTEVKTIDGTSGYYYLLVGVLSSMSDDGTRSLAPLFGYTEILPNQILTSSVRSANGDTILDLETGVLSLNSNSSNSEQGAGINGRLALSPIAAWFGGPMVDYELNPTATDYAKSLFRFDGTGYLASGNITWDANGYGQVGGNGDDYAIKWNDNGIFLSSGIKITESGQETLATLLEAVTELRSWFGKDDEGDIYLKPDANGRDRGLYTKSFLSSGGKSESSSGGGSADYTQWGWDDIIQLTSDPGMGNLASAWALKQEYDSRQSALSILSQGVTSIRLLIPSSASESNQLADKEFVNSSIASNTATFRGTFEGVSYLPSGAKLNDYAFVIATDASGNPEYNRYKYTSSGWVFEYTLNNSSFTAEQWSAITSGITANLVSLYSEHIANTSNPHAVTKAQIGLADVENIKLSSWAGSTNITTLGAVTTGEWKASKIANDYLVNSTISIGSTTVALGGAIEALSGIASISLKGNNDAKLTYDNGAWHLSGNLLVDGYITAGGVGSSSGSGGIDSAAMWALLGDATNEQINKTHISSALEGYQSIIPDLATIRNDAANGNTAYGWGNHSGKYLPLAGGTITGEIRSIRFLTNVDSSTSETGIWMGSAFTRGLSDEDFVLYAPNHIIRVEAGYFQVGLNAVYHSGNLTAATLGLGNVENTALSTWVGTTNITTLGTIATGVWHGSAIADNYIASASAWNNKWDYNENTIKEVKVNNAGNADTLESHSASYFATASSLGNYLPLSGGTITSSSDVPVIINSTHGNGTVAINLQNNNVNKGQFLYTLANGTGIYDFPSDKGLFLKSGGIYYGSESGAQHTIYHSGNSNLSTVGWTCSHLKTTHIYIECNADGTPTGRDNEINTFSDPLHLQYATAQHISLCIGGGNVGIGTTSPSEKLDVNGAIRMSYTGNVTSGLYPNNWITSGGEATTLWLYNEKRLHLYGTTIELRNNTVVDGNLTAIGTVAPSADKTYTLGTASAYWDDFYVKGVIHAYHFNKATDQPFIVFDKPGSHCAGIGPDGTTNRIKFGPVNDITSSNPAWVAQGTFSANEWYFQGSIVATGAITAGTASDSRLKDNIATLCNASSVLRQLRGVGFDWNALATDKSSYFKGHDVGLIAQEVELLIPSAIGTIWGEYKRLDYAKITPYLVEGWKEHDTEINRLRARVSELESEVNKLRQYVN